MKKCTKIILICFIALITLLSFKSFVEAAKLKEIDVNSLNFNSISPSKVEDLKKAIEAIDVTSLDSSAVINSINKNEISSRQY